MYVYEYSGEIYHHGIKGMKWGVRRFQKKDGTLTPAGKKRYGDDREKKVSKHRTNLERKYRSGGMSEAEAKAAADKRIKVEKTMAVMAGVTVGACAAYYAKNKWVADHCDQVLKAGTTFHNLDSAANYRPGEHLYVAYRQNDKDYFRGHFALGKIRKSGQVFNHTITATDDVKIPSLNTRKSVFKQLYENDPDFKKAFDDHSGIPGFKNLNSSSKIGSSLAYRAMWPKFGDKDTPEFNEAKHKYFKALKEKGYSAIVDEWDTNKRVFRSDAPLILLDTSHKSLGEMTIKELTSKDILLGQANSRNYARSRQWLNMLGTPHTNHFNESSKDRAKYAAKTAKNSEYITSFLKKYKEEHGADNLADYVQVAVRTESGAQIADAGKYVKKYQNMSATEAMKKAQKKHDAIKKVETAAGYSVMATPYVAYQVAYNNHRINQYRDHHPNSKLSDTEILKILG